MSHRSGRHLIIDGRTRWQTVAMRGLVVPAVVIGLVVGAASSLAPGPPVAAPEARAVSPAPPPRSIGLRSDANISLATRAAPAAWQKRISAIVAGKSVGVAVRLDDTVLYERRARGARTPASNQKLLLSMALFDLLGPSTRIVTKVAARKVDGNVVRSDLYVLGTGDPTVTGGGRFGTSLPLRPTRLKRLARHIKAAGVTRIDGRIVGSENYFAHDWFAPGWKSDFPSRYVALPSALTFDGNSHKGIHFSDPERRAAGSLTKKLEAIGIAVDGEPAAGHPPDGLTALAQVQSEPIRVLARFMNRTSSNFFAEVLGKRLGAESIGRPGTIAKAAAAIRRWSRRLDVTITARDASGLSYRNRVSPRGITRLLDAADDERWWHGLRSSLPTGGEGTLENRLTGVRVRAKTGTLEGFSALSGWVWLTRRAEWAPFSILSAGMPKYKATAVEDRIVRILESRAH
jgi:D-alanyl-D-alanine carboxypeptidase/D-alanyl-D-alanine-endopeptidase (penicillin-binding protein 4)